MNARGFTLLEALIVVAIAGLLLAAGGPSLTDYTANNRLRSVAEQMRDGLNHARLEAIRRNTTIQFVPNGTGWTVVQPAVGQTPAVTIARRDGYAAETSVVSTPTADSISFNGSGRLTTAGPYTVRLTQSGGTCAASGGTARCLNVVAVRGGQVRMCDPAQESSKPEGC
jgi:type IV fimbrial biogenesis protein FimT